MTTGLLRYDFQIAACAHAQGPVLNIGAGEDPAFLRTYFGSRVINCDLHAFDTYMHRPNLVDRVFDAAEFPWPFDSDFAHTVIFGDIIQGFPFSQAVDVLKEAHRVGYELCITVPTDKRTKGVIYTEQVLRDLVSQSDWTPYIFMEGDWGFTDDNYNPVMGFCLMAYRS